MDMWKGLSQGAGGGNEMMNKTPQGTTEPAPLCTVKWPCCPFHTSGANSLNSFASPHTPGHPRLQAGSALSPHALLCLHHSPGLLIR